jgi:hypothetical protein
MMMMMMMMMIPWWWSSGQKEERKEPRRKGRRKKKERAKEIKEQEKIGKMAKDFCPLIASTNQFVSLVGAPFLGLSR